ncbi:GNAT family N-acetyltransferase [Macrococcus bovicus]|uniref:GNAT family N-acetyltransferase n=1 Tax=Macrococcus bovicus TaxID=69968 RepID=UPI0025A56034|nr:GNAT family N-acetyltransferase [Macrococcus bovicus]WJP97996.1 GNAT family N-acetyltransferase [Macrococcus bovicus]
MDIKKTAQFIHTLNQAPEHRVGYLPRSSDAIETLLSTLSDDQIIMNDQTFIGLIKEDDSAKVLGPLTTDFNLHTIYEMWRTLTSRHPDIKTYEFYIAERYQFGQQAMKSLKTQYLGTQYTMTAERLTDKIDTRQVIKYSPIYKKSFCELLKSLYVDVSAKKKEILDALDDHYELFLLLSEGIVKGYVILEANDHAICYIDHVETHKHYRQQGIGHKLVAYAAEHAFSEHQATAIQLVVEDKRKRTIEFYEKLGFQKTEEMHHFKYTTI